MSPSVTDCHRSSLFNCGRFGAGRPFIRLAVRWDRRCADRDDMRLERDSRSTRRAVSCDRADRDCLHGRGFKSSPESILVRQDDFSLSASIDFDQRPRVGGHIRSHVLKTVRRSLISRPSDSPSDSRNGRRIALTRSSVYSIPPRSGVTGAAHRLQQQSLVTLAFALLLGCIAAFAEHGLERC